MNCAAQKLNRFQESSYRLVENCVGDNLCRSAQEIIGKNNWWFIVSNMQDDDSDESPVATIYDKSRRAYEIQSVGDSMFLAFHNSSRVGHLYCHCWGKTGEIADLKVEHDVLRRGLGTALLAFALQYLKDEGCEKVVGKIVEIDYRPNPWLPDWYRKKGFNVPESGKGEIWKLLN